MQRFFVELKKDPNSLDMNETLDDWKKKSQSRFIFKHIIEIKS